MTTTLQTGHAQWSLARDEQGYREYRVVHKIKADKTDGPFNVMNTPGLPLPGAMWSFFSDVDPWVWCRSNAEVKPIRSDDSKTYWWTVEQIFSNKPTDIKKCQDVQIEDPLLEPQRVSGSFIKYQEEAHVDRWNDPITNSAHEQMRGDQVMVDRNRPQVRIEQNVPVLQIPLFAPMVDCVNAFALWGLPPRCIKLSDVSWERRFYGQCYVYYVRTFTFDIFARLDIATGELVSGWDKDLVDEGSKCLNGHISTAAECERGGWILDDVCGVPPDPNNALHFCRFKDRNGENCRVMLDGHGLPAEMDILPSETGVRPEIGTGSVFFGKISSGDERISKIGKVHVEFYDDANFLLLGIPTTF